MRIFALISALVLTQTAALAQHTTSSRIEVWGLKGETQAEFEARHRARTGYGLDGACMATLKGVMGYAMPGVYEFPNPSSPNSTTMVISIGDLPSFAFPTTVSEHRSITLPQSWSTVRGIIAKEPAGYGTMELGIAEQVLASHRRGDSVAVARKIAVEAERLASFGVALDDAKLDSILAALASAGSAPLELTVDIYLHSDSLAYRTLAAHVLRNHLDDPRAIDAFARNVWDKDLGGDARIVLTSCLRMARESNSTTTGKRLSLPPFDGSLLAAMLSHPRLELCDLALEVLAHDPLNESLTASAFSGSATTLKYYLRSKLTKHSEYARDFRADAIDVLRRLSPIDHGDDIDKWIGWIDSFANN